jgi:hypothetical protein
MEKTTFSLGHPVRQILHHTIYVPPLPTSIHELRDRITHALESITADMLHRVWDEFDYSVDVRRVRQAAYIGDFYLAHEKVGQLPLLTV